jgi:arylsulfatase A-like enzyme
MPVAQSDEPQSAPTLTGAPVPARGSPVVQRLRVIAAAVFLIGVAVRTLMFWVLADSPLPVAPLHWMEQAGLVGYRLLAGLPGVLWGALAVGAVQLSAQQRGILRYVMAAAGWALVLAFEFFRFASWATFESTRHFLAMQSWNLTSADPSLMAAHAVQMEPWIFVGVPLAAVVVALTTVLLCGIAASAPARAQRVLTRLVAVVLVASVVAAVGGDALSMKDTTRFATAPRQPAETAHQAFLYAAREQSGPVARLLADLWDDIASVGADLQLWNPGGTVGPRIVTMGEYVAHTARRRVHRWNVVLVVVESLRADELRSLGGARAVMPTVDSLAEHAMVFARALTAATQSDFATTSLLSSQYPLRARRYRAFPAHIAYPRVLLWDVLQAQGWHTGVFSSQNEHWAGMFNFLNTGGVGRFVHGGNYRGPTYASADDHGFWNFFVHNARQAGKIDDHDTVDEGIAWIDSVPASAPFFAYFNLQSSHTPYVHPSTFASRFGPGNVSFPVLFGSYPADSAAAVRDLYDNSLAYVDAQLARLVAALQRSHRWDSTLVVLTGDHGEAFYEHGFGAHASALYREVTRVPLIFRVPGAAAARDSLPASTIDIAPTVIDMLGLPPHPSFQGVDLHDVDTRRTRPVFTLSQALADQVAVEAGPWVLIDDLRGGTQQLYDVRADPLETDDVADSHPKLHDTLVQVVERWWGTQINYYESLHGAPRRYAPRSPRLNAADLGASTEPAIRGRVTP